MCFSYQEVLNWTHCPKFCLTSAEETGRITSLSLLATLSNAAQDAVGPFVQPVEVPVKGSTTIWFTSHSLQYHIICRLAEDAVSYHPSHHWRCEVILAPVVTTVTASDFSWALCFRSQTCESCSSGCSQSTLVSVHLVCTPHQFVSEGC